MIERIMQFDPKNVIGERPYTRTLESVQTEQIVQVRSQFGVIVGVTAVHGLEPQQIAANVGLALNYQFGKYGQSPLPIVLPFVAGDAIYGERTGRVLRAVYNQRDQQQIYLSEELGHALLNTEFGSAGYQQHLVNVRKNISMVHNALQEWIREPFSVVSLDGKNKRTINPTSHRVLEINAGANATLARDNKNVDAYEVFPVTFDGLIQYVQKHNRFFQYDKQLVRDVREIASSLRQYISGIILPDLHTLGEETWFNETFPEAFITPPWKERLEPPAISIDLEEETITVFNHTGLIDKATGYHPDKGVVYVNVSGSDLGASSAKRFVLNAQDEGYVVATTPWLKEKWIQEEGGKVLESNMRNVLAAEPNILFSQDLSADHLCKAFFMRLGMGSYAYAQLAEVPVIFLGFEALENPEMKGNSNVIEKHKLGIRYTGQPNIIKDVQTLAKNYTQFNQIVYDRYDIPKGLEGLSAVSNIIVLDQINRLLSTHAA